MSVLLELLASKKFVMALIGMIAAVAGKYGLALDEGALLTILSPLLAAIGAQGVADFGKERVKTLAKIGDEAALQHEVDQAGKV